MKQGLLVACVFISCSVLAPLMWHMWIILGTANSNYYFGVTLAYNVGQVRIRLCRNFIVYSSILYFFIFKIYLKLMHFISLQIFLITDLLFAYLKREFYLSNGIKVDDKDKPLKLELSAE